MHYCWNSRWNIWFRTKAHHSKRYPTTHTAVQCKSWSTKCVLAKFSVISSNSLCNTDIANCKNKSTQIACYQIQFNKFWRSEHVFSCKFQCVGDWALKLNVLKQHDDVIKWKHFTHYWASVKVPGEFPTQRLVTRSFDVLFDLHPNKRLSKQGWGWWFETPSGPLWRHCNARSWNTDVHTMRRYQRKGWLYLCRS